MIADTNDVLQPWVLFGDGWRIVVSTVTGATDYSFHSYWYSSDDVHIIRPFMFNDYSIWYSRGIIIHSMIWPLLFSIPFILIEWYSTIDDSVHDDDCVLHPFMGGIR